MFPCGNGDEIEHMIWFVMETDDCPEGEDEKDCDETSGDLGRWCTNKIILICTFQFAATKSCSTYHWWKNTIYV